MSSVVRYARVTVAAAIAATGLALAGSGGAFVDTSALAITNIVIEDGVAFVSGVVDDTTADLEINGVPIDIDQTGDFLANVDLVGNELVLELVEASTESTEIRIPVDVLVANGSEGVLNDLLGAGIEINAPIDGFEVVDNQMPVVVGQVLDASNLSVLEVNGTDVLSHLDANGWFSIFSPRYSSSGGTHYVVITAVDRRGVTQTNRYATRTVSSAIRTRAGTSVSAAGAQGIRIAKVRLDAKSLKKNRRLGVLVTVKDTRGFLIRGASLRLRAMPAGALATGAVRAGFTNSLGQARFTYRLRAGMLAAKLPKFLTVATQASTPAARTTLQVRLRLPAAA
jgi:hypothetical protein